MFIGVNDHRAFFRGDSHRHDLLFESSVRNSLDRPLVAQKRQFILLLPGDLIFFRQIFRGVSHMVSHHCTDQAVGHHAVQHLAISHPVAFAGPFQQIGRLGHAFDSHRNHNIVFAQHNRLAGDFKRLHAGTALLVHRAGVAFHRHAALELDLTSGISLRARLIDLAANDFLNFCRRQTCLFQSGINRRHAEVNRADVLEFP